MQVVIIQVLVTFVVMTPHYLSFFAVQTVLLMKSIVNNPCYAYFRHLTMTYVKGLDVGLCCDFLAPGVLLIIASLLHHLHPIRNHMLNTVLHISNVSFKER